MVIAHIELTPELSPLPESEQRVLLRALAKNPAQRYASCVEFARALQQELVQEEVVKAMPRARRKGKGAFGEAYEASVPRDAMPPMMRPSASPAVAGTPSYLPPEAPVERQATVRYYSRMNPQRMFPLLVMITGKTLRAIAEKAVDQQQSSSFQVEKGTTVEVEPILPGCTCYPPREQVSIHDDEASARFWVVPHVLGKIMEPRVLVRQNGKLLAEVALRIRVVKQTYAVCLALLAFVLPAISAVLKHYRLDFGSQLEEGFGTYAQLLQRIYDAVTPGLLLALFLAAAVLAYLVTRPRRREVFWDITPADAKDHRTTARPH
jgi:hypothetical protein